MPGEPTSASRLKTVHVLGASRWPCEAMGTESSGWPPGLLCSLPERCNVSSICSAVAVNSLYSPLYPDDAPPSSRCDLNASGQRDNG